MPKTDMSDYDLPFEQRYLTCAEAMEKAAHWLTVCGLGASTNLVRLQQEFIRHGGETFRDINRDK